MSNSQSPNQRSVTPSASASPGSSSSLGKSRSSSAKPVNIFSSDGSFLDRIKHTMKEEDEKRKEQEILERKKHFADRFKQRGKRLRLTSEHSSGTSGTDSQGPTSEPETPPYKKQKVEKSTSTIKDEGESVRKDQSGKEEAVGKDDSKSAQAEYREAVGSYPTSLKDSGTGVRPLVK